jgi:hypothetical protein
MCTVRSFIIYTLHQIVAYVDDQIKEESSMHRGEEKCILNCGRKYDRNKPLERPRLR